MPLPTTTCQKCQHTRILRKEQPLRCPQCGHKPTAKIYKPRKEKQTKCHDQTSTD